MCSQMRDLIRRLRPEALLEGMGAGDGLSGTGAGAGSASGSGSGGGSGSGSGSPHGSGHGHGHSLTASSASLAASADAHAQMMRVKSMVDQFHEIAPHSKSRMSASGRSRTLSFQWPAAGGGGGSKKVNIEALQSLAFNVWDYSVRAMRRAPCCRLYAACCVPRPCPCPRPGPCPSPSLLCLPLHPSVPCPLTVFAASHISCLMSLSWSWSCFQPNDLKRFTLLIFEDLGLFEEFKIPQVAMVNFVNQVAAKYQDMPFHNWRHGFSVLQFSYWALRHTNASNFVCSEDVLALSESSRVPPS